MSSRKDNHSSYAASGVNYDVLDAFKRRAQRKGMSTSENLERFAMQEVGGSRGESAYIWEEKDSFRAIVVEGLGTKNIIADETAKITSRSYYRHIAWDTVAMIVNDLIVVGAKPQVVNAYFAVGRSDWFANEKRAEDLAEGWKQACEASGAVWGGGETSVLKDIIKSDTIDLAGSAAGIVAPKERLVLGDRLAPGDLILLIESSGIHANGITLVRSLARKLTKGYGTTLNTGKIFGESLLTPTHIYASLVRGLQEEDVDIHYMVHITGHGWRKLMRAATPFTYHIHQLPPPLPVFDFIKKHSGIDDREMYATFNMGAGFALFVPPKESLKVQKIASKHHFKSWVAGTVEAGPKSVWIEPINVIFSGEDLKVR